MPPPIAAGADPLPVRLSDAEFWHLVSEFSEPTGAFLSDNFVSNEDTFQQVIPRLTMTAKRGGAYLGVGPDQNFTYIVALRPRVAFIVDIRRQNLLLHLLYKAAIELSDDRAEMLSRLFSRPRPAGLGPRSTPDALLNAYQAVPMSDALFQRNVRAIEDWLIRHHHFALSGEDVNVLEYVYTAFASGGPDIRYSIPREPRLRFPSYAELMRQTDNTGMQRSYLATEENFPRAQGSRGAKPHCPDRGGFRRRQGARRGGPVSERSRRLRVGVLHVERRDVSVRGSARVEEVLRQSGWASH